eukprot:scaffold22130_cov62-Cyclotella_meneghiniana.AAC.12
MRVALITISYCSLPVYLKSCVQGRLASLTLTTMTSVVGVIVCDVCFNALLLSLSLKVAERFGALQKFSACVRPSSVATVSSDTVATPMPTVIRCTAR